MWSLNDNAMKQRLKTILFVTIAIAAGFESEAQQDPMFSQYMFNLMTINPAYAGNREVLSTTALYRSDLKKREVSPETYMLTADWVLREKRIGLGFQVYKDDLVVLQNLGFFSNYSYRIHLQKATLSFGMRVGATKYGLSRDLLLQDYADPTFAGNYDSWRLHVGTGLFFYTKEFYLGFSTPNILSNRQVRTSADGDEIQEQPSHWFLTSGYVFELSPDLTLKPSLLFAMVPGAPMHLDINANLWLHNLVSIGGSYRTGRALVGLLEVQINPQIRLGYAYNYAISEFDLLNANEIMLRYEFGKTKRNLVSPRYF
jgi:type IX secretion system PorP/SprF family membrane protein